LRAALRHTWSAPARGYPPQLNVAPMALWCEFTTHHLYAALCDVLHGSLIVENRRRLEHLENAIRCLDKDSTRLKLEANALRQEEITEEIEVILRSAEALADAEQA
jgi:F-type H+-transporting ATPase subunit gamma